MSEARYVALAGILAGCTCSGAVPEPTDAAPDVAFSCEAPAPGATLVCGDGLRISAPTCSPDGLGWCCVPDGPTCECTATGGFAASRDECCGARAFGTCDVHPLDWRGGTDEHGCPELTVGGFEHACF